MRHSLSILTLAILLVMPAAAQNIGFMSKGPIAYLNDSEKKLLKETLKQALNDGDDGETITWNHPDTGSNGIIELLDTHVDFGTTCRTINTQTSAQGREGGGRYRLCKADDDTWRFAPRRRKSS